MATVILMPMHWDANLNAAFALARALLARGHRVHLLCLPDTEERIRSQGFDFHPVFARTFPTGTLPAQYEREARGLYLGADGFKSRIRGMCQSLLEGELERGASALGADLFLVSSQTPWVTIGAWRTGVPVATFSSSLISVPDPCVPPFGTALRPGRGPLSRAMARLAWRRFFIRRRFVDRAWDIAGEVADFALRCGYPLDGIDRHVETWPRVKVPSLVLCPSEFDFPRSRVPEGVHFVEPGIDTRREAPGFPWERLEEGRPIVYCALGSVATHKYLKEAMRFFGAFLEALSRRPRWQGVAAVGRHAKLEDLRVPRNVVLVRDAPQLRLLERASLSLTHGGFGSVKESIFMGVPMVVFPLAYDQPGTSARIVHHGLGVRERFDRASAPVITRMIETVLGDAGYRERTELMAGRFREMQAHPPSVGLLENLIARRPVGEILAR